MKREEDRERERVQKLPLCWYSALFEQRQLLHECILWMFAIVDIWDENLFSKIIKYSTEKTLI